MVACTTCGRENPPDSRFCNGCAAAMESAAVPAREERKIVTVLFADLVGFTSRAERMDPEDVRALLAPYWESLRSDLERFGGTVEKFIGDAVMAIFGAPVSHEDDPERALRAALAIRDRVRESDEELQVRIAVNTGEALVLLGARPAEGEGMAAGDVVNTAARLQTAAPVNGVLVGEATYRATRHVIDYAEADPVLAKGKTDSLRVWEAIAARSRPTVETMSAAALVGRRDELELLAGALNRAQRDREPQLVTVAGVPGIGKSRLVAELFTIADSAAELIRWRRGRSLSYGDNVSLWALGEIVKAELGVLESDSRAETSAKLRSSLTELLEEPERTWVEGHLAPLLGLPGDDARDQSAAAWRRWLEALAERHPLVLVFEDLQWADDELLDFVDQLTDWVTDVPLLVLCTTRPELFERRPGWGGGKRNAVAISLGPLEDADTARIVAAALDQALLPAETQAALLERAAGNPLYAEQYARMVAEGAEPDVLPENVQGIVAARIDLLSPEEKSLLQDAAVIGRVFWASAIDAPDGALHSLVRKEFIRRERRSSIAGEPEYAFAHALVRDVAYGQIPRGTRAERHRRAADWLESLPADRAIDRAEMLAHHYAAAIELGEAAGVDTRALSDPARRAFRDAGDRAASLNAHAAAARFYSSALDLSPPDHPSRPGLLLARAETLSYIGGDTVADAAEAVALLVEGADPEAMAAAETILARACWFQGDGVAATDHARRAHELVAACEPSQVKAEAVVERARVLMLSGFREEAVVLATEGCVLSEALGLDTLHSSALITRGTAQHTHEEGLADLTHGIALAESVNAVAQVYRGLNNLAEHHVERGDLAPVDDIYARVREIAQRFGHAAQLRWVDGQDVVNQFLVGNWDRALAHAGSLISADEAGQRSYQTANGYSIRSYIRHARGESGSDADGELAVEHARRIGDPQALCPTLSGYARILALDGETDRAWQLLEEVLNLYRSLASAPYVWVPPLVWAVVAVGDVDEYGLLLDRLAPGPWVDAARAACAGDFARAAEVYGSMGAASDAAEAMVNAAARLRAQGDRHGSDAQALRAIAFYRSVGASRLIRDAEALLSATA